MKVTMVSVQCVTCKGKRRVHERKRCTLCPKCGSPEVMIGVEEVEHTCYFVPSPDGGTETCDCGAWR